MLPTTCSQDTFINSQNPAAFLSSASPLPLEEEAETPLRSFTDIVLSLVEPDESIPSPVPLKNPDFFEPSQDREEDDRSLEHLLSEDNACPSPIMDPTLTWRPLWDESATEMASSAPPRDPFEFPIFRPDLPPSFEALSLEDVRPNTHPIGSLTAADDPSKVEGLLPEEQAQDISFDPEFSPSNIPTHMLERTPQAPLGSMDFVKQDKSLLDILKSEEPHTQDSPAQDLSGDPDSQAFLFTDPKSPPFLKADSQEDRASQKTQDPLPETPRSFTETDPPLPNLQQTPAKTVSVSQTVDPVRIAFQQIVTGDGSPQQIRIQLHPQHLGTVEISFQFKGQDIFLSFKGEPEALAILKEQAHTLTQPLLDNGFSLSEGSLDFGAFSEEGHANGSPFGAEGGVLMTSDPSPSDPSLSSQKDAIPSQHINILLNDTLSTSSKGLML